MKDKEIFKSTMEDKLKLQSRANERYRDQIFEEIKELEQKKSEEALRMVQKNHDLWKYQNESDEARRLQSCGNSIRVRKGLDLQHPTSSELCRSSMVDHDEEMTLEPPRKRPRCKKLRRRLSGRRREEEKKKHGGGSQKGETEVLETGIVADEVEGTYVDSDGEGHHGRGKVKNHRS